MKYFITLVLFLLISRCLFAQNVWTNAYTKNVHDEIYSQFKQSIPDDIKRGQIVDCLIGKLKTDLPGGIKSIPRDSLIRLSTVEARECARTINNLDLTLTLTAENEKVLRDNLVRELNKKIDANGSNQIADCVISKLKSLYPYGTEIHSAKSVIDSLGRVCAKDILNR